MSYVHDRVGAVLRDLARLQEGAVVDYSRDAVSRGRGGKGRHGGTTAPPPGAHDRDPFSAPLAIVWGERFDRMVRAARREHDDYVRRRDDDTTADGDRVSAAKRRIDRAILRDCTGMTVYEVAFVYSRSTEAVRKLRIREGLDPENGERTAPRPLTAPATATAKGYRL